MNVILTAILGALISVLPTKLEIVKPLQAPVIIYVNDIDESAAIKFAVDMDSAQATGQSVIPVVIDSYGGSVYSLLTMIDILKASKVPVATIVTGKAMSAGAVLFTCGTEGMRFVAPNATIMIHQVSSMMGGKSSDVTATAAEMDRLNKRLFAIMAKNIGKEDKFLLDILHTKGNIDWYLVSEEARALNIANTIGVPTLETKITIESILTLPSKTPISPKK